MTRRRKTAFWAGGVLLITLVALYFSTPVQFVLGMTIQMRAGRAFMDSLTDSDIRNWITQSDSLLAQHTNTLDGIPNTPVPDDLVKLKILRLDVIPPDIVAYMWVGGFDHTGLIIHRDSDGGHTVTARYDDEHERQLWPKRDRRSTARYQSKDDWRFIMNLPAAQTDYETNVFQGGPGYSRPAAASP